MMVSQWVCQVYVSLDLWNSACGNKFQCQTAANYERKLLPPIVFFKNRIQMWEKIKTYLQCSFTTQVKLLDFKIHNSFYDVTPVMIYMWYELTVSKDLINDLV